MTIDYDEDALTAAYLMGKADARDEDLGLLRDALSVIESLAEALDGDAHLLDGELRTMIALRQRLGIGGTA